MASTCMSRCVDDARIPVRATYVNLYKWPESDFEFVRSMSSTGQGQSHRMYGHPRVVDSFSCRQLYLRSYTFSREDDYADADDGKTALRCLSRRKKEEKKKKKKETAEKGASCSVLGSIFRRLLSCTTKVDVAN